MTHSKWLCIVTLACAWALILNHVRVSKQEEGRLCVKLSLEFEQIKPLQTLFIPNSKAFQFLSDDAFGLSKHTSFVLWVGKVPSLSSHLAWASIPRLLWLFKIFFDKSEKALARKTPLSAHNKARSSWLPLALWHFFDGRKEGREMSTTFGLEQVPNFQWKLLAVAQLFNFCQGVNVAACCFFSCQSLPWRMAHSCSLELLAKNKCSLQRQFVFC